MKSSIENYADLILQTGLNLKKGCPLAIRGPIEAADFIKIVTKRAYVLGVSFVTIEWIDDELTRMKFDFEPIENFEEIPSYIVDKYEYLDALGASYLSISSTDPDSLNGIDTSKLVASSQARNKYLNAHTTRTMSDELKWCVVGVPSLKWSQKVFPGKSNSLELLWEQILKATRCDKTNPIELWEEHINDLSKYRDYLNDSNFKTLKFKNNLGTDLTIELPNKHAWAAGSSVDAKDDRFVANIPTEEIFTLPHREKINGVVSSTKPLNYNGNLIDEFVLEFKDGRVVNSKAKVGEAILNDILDIDFGARSLGEVAIVDHYSPISSSGILFYNTLFDENASCHLALGRAYPTSISDFSTLTSEELLERGANTSAIHIDFMFGSACMSITGITQCNEEVNFFVDGKFNI